MSTNASAYTITLNGNLSCTDVAVQESGGGQATLTCTPPDLPAGSYPLSVVQAGKGQMSAPPSKPNNTMSAGGVAACRQRALPALLQSPGPWPSCCICRCICRS